MKISKKEYLQAEMKLESLLAVVTEKGGFEVLNANEKEELGRNTELVRLYEEQNYTLEMPQTFEGILELKMFEKKIKQKDLAVLLETSDTQLSEVMHKKRKPTIALLKNIHQKLGVDGNLLLKLV